MKSYVKIIFVFLVSLFLNLAWVKPALAQSSFRFVAWGDTKNDTNTLKNLSTQIKNAINPAFTLYAGDLQDSGWTSGIETWKTALNGGTNNGLFDVTFVVRGNHDSGNTAGWQGYFNMNQHTTNTGSTNYVALNDDLTYSFDHGNSRFIGIDVLGDVTSMSSASIAWLDQRLADAESRGLKHAFLFFHGPMYAGANHCCPVAPSGLVNVINRHNIVSATFNGHEHMITYTHLNSSRIPGLAHEVEQFISGDAGAGPTTATGSRVDYYLNVGNMGGFVVVDVNGDSYTVNFYKGGTNTSQYSKTFTKSGSPQPTQTPNPTTPPGGKRGDINGDNSVDIVDIGIIIDVYGLPASANPKANLNNDNVINIIDVGIVIDNYGR